MKNSLTFYIYSLYRSDQEDDWCNLDSEGNPSKKDICILVDEVVLNECSDNLCIGGIGKDNKYYQFDSYEAYYAESYFRKNFDIHGLYIESKKVSIDREHLKVCTNN